MAANPGRPTPFPWPQDQGLGPLIRGKMGRPEPGCRIFGRL